MKPPALPATPFCPPTATRAAPAFICRNADPDHRAAMLALFILILALCAGVSQWAAGRYRQVLDQGGRERAPTAHTGGEIARLFLDSEDLQDVAIVEHNGLVSDCYDPRRRRLFLRRETLQGTTLAAWAVALHEAAHAAQTGEAQAQLLWRQQVIRMTRYGPMFALLIAGGLVVLLKFNTRFALAAVLGLCVIFLLLNLGTLAVEYNANARLRRFLERHCQRHGEALDRLTAHLGRVATREVGDLLQSPRYFLFSALPGSGRIRPQA